MEHFVVVPDHEAVSAAGCLSWKATHTVAHRSGRPWVLARLVSSTLVRIQAAGNTVVLIGPGDPTTPALTRAVAACRTAADLDRVVTTLPGLFHVIAAIDGDGIRVQGTASGTRQVFYTRCHGGWWAADRARTLAGMVNAPLDTTALALRLLEPVPHPLAERPLWTGVRPVPPGTWLHLGHTEPRTHPWWRPPQPRVPLAVGAREVREALRSSVRHHIRDRTAVSGELSGGFDSTSLMFLAARERPVLAVTAESLDPLDDDTEWALLAARHCGQVDHRVVAAHDVPLVYADLHRAVEPLDEPSIGVASRSRVLAMTEPGRAAGADVHLTGHGGDHLFVGLATLCTDLLPRHPWSAARRIRAYRGMFRWPRTEIARQLLLRGPYRRWLASHGLSGTGADPRHPILTWGLGATIPPWTTSHGAGLIHEAIRRQARTARPLAPGPGRHLELDGLRDGARLVRALTDITACAGLPLSAPFFDDRVIEAALRVRIQDKVQPHRYKPLLAEAMRDLVPDALLRRSTKGVGDLAQALGQRTHAQALADMWSDSRLADLGLIDAARLKTLCQVPESPELDDGGLLTTVACETWLRTL